MTRARRELVDLNTTSYYHCICRCVRRAFLCGEDHLTGKNFEHRKAWVLERLATLSRIYAIDVCAYAVMSNHYHLVVRIDQSKARNWTEDQILLRWKTLFKLPLLVERYRKGEASQAEARVAKEIIEQWRARLTDLSWYMRSLNEHLARRANEEDRCKGRFWEGRYKSQALLDDAAVLTCMSYVDLNPIRAGIAETPEGSDHTSIQQRIRAWQARRTKADQKGQNRPTDQETRIRLMPLIKQSQDNHIHAIGYSARDYIELVDWAGRAIRNDKRGAIDNNLPPILQRLNLEPDAFLHYMQGQQNRLSEPTALGAKERLKTLATRLEQKYFRGQSAFQRIYRPTLS